MLVKKAKAFLLVMILVLSLAGCAKGVGESTSSVGSMPVPSQGEMEIESSQPSGESTASQQAGQSSEESAASTTAKAYSTKAQANLNTGSYQVKSAKYSYRKDNLNYSVNYPQLSGSVASLDKVNKALETCAMKTVQSMGTAKREHSASVRCTGDVTYEGKNFLSVGFNEYQQLSPKAAKIHTMRTVNLDLKTGQAIGFSDMIIKNDDFYLALLQAAKKQNADLASALTATVIKEGLDTGAIYFTDEAVGFSVQMKKPEQKLIRITLDYKTIKQFASANAAWGNFM